MFVNVFNAISPLLQIKQVWFLPRLSFEILKCLAKEKDVWQLQWRFFCWWISGTTTESDGLNYGWWNGAWDWQILLCKKWEQWYGMWNVALFDIFIFLLDLTSLLLYIFGFVFNVWPFLFFMFRFYSIFYDLHSISVYFYCIIFVYIVYSVICIVYFWICI